jgi:hypothetical protein
MRMSNNVGWIYIVGSFEKLKAVKIGISAKPVRFGRLDQIQTSFPYHLHVYAEFPVNKHRLRNKEKNIHTLLKEYKMKGEWFNLHPTLVVETVKKELGLL